MADINTDMNLKSLEDLYSKKNYEEATSLLIKNKDAFSPGLFHYNLGTVYTKWGSLAAGRYHLEKSIKHDFINSHSLNNLKYVQEKLAVDDLSTSSRFYDRFMDISLGVPLSLYLFVGLLSLTILLILKKTGRVKKWLAVFAFSLAGFIPLGFKVFYLNNINYAVLLEESVVREGPSRIFDQKSSLSSGTKVIIKGYDSGWYFISHPIHLSGWIERKKLGLY